MRLAFERAYYSLSRVVGRLLRSATYSTVYLDEGTVRKRRAVDAPILISLGRPLVRILNTGMRVLPQREWEERECSMYERLYETPITVDTDGTLVLPRLPGRTLAALLENRALDAAERRRAIEIAAVALAELHAAGFTHGDAMAENVMVDLDARVARWFDFETAHDASRSLVWRRADDLRALLATVLVRTPPNDFGETLARIVDTYADESIMPDLATSFASVWSRALVFHVGQAPLSFEAFRQVGRLLSARLTSQGGHKPSFHSARRQPMNVTRPVVKS